ncbi:hypothetical protein BS330_12875 [Amycolatopsis keratiniphila subsp. nogabecina]|nr:hypothetical protein BS330_12875 [Amycolatopsis keratiniphila subsp. nogabecina]
MAMLDRGPAPEEIGLAAYARAVADEVQAVVGGAIWEARPSLMAYIALSSECVLHPGRDVMLTWSPARGWEAALEAAIDGPMLLLARLGEQVAPDPSVVARFADEVLRGEARCETGLPTLPDGVSLAGELLPYVFRVWLA